MKNILVGVDFLKHTDDLIKTALELASAMNSKIWLLHVAAPDPDYVGYEAGPQFIRNERAEELKNEHHLMTEYVNEIRAKSINAEGLLVQGPTIETIISESNKLFIDLIICGHHRHNYLYNALFGSHSKSILMKSNIPVLVIPFSD